ncbi:MAG TPA: hypothetical protein VF624_03880 [Tepidisphaeraceae bacterium]|jgi:hypothetical protein
MHQTLQELCAQGQQHLLATDYLAAERTLAKAEARAYADDDFDTLARLYMPLQEARRQRRQRCGEGVVMLDLVSGGPDEVIYPEAVLEKYPHGQLLVAGFGSIEPARAVRGLALQGGQFVESFLAASYRVGEHLVVALVPHDAVTLPEPGEYGIDALQAALPPHSIIFNRGDLPAAPRQGDTATFALTMNLWERLHGPFLAMGDGATDLRRKVEGYRLAISVDYACEFAHQRLSTAAQQLARETSGRAAEGATGGAT